MRKLVKADKMAFIVLGFDRQNGTYCVILSFIIIRTKYFVIASGNKGTPRDTFVPVGKRNKQAKDKQLTFTAIVWSKAQFMTYRPEGNPYCNDIKYFVPNEIR